MPDVAYLPERSAQLSGTVRHHAAPTRNTDSESLGCRFEVARCATGGESAEATQRVSAGGAG